MSKTLVSRPARGFSPAAAHRWSQSVLHAVGQGRRYLQRVGEIVHKICGVLRSRIAIVLVISIIASGARGGALGALMLYVKQSLDENAATPAWLAAISFGPETPIWSGVICLGLFVAGALAAFGCGRISARYSIECIAQLIPKHFGPAIVDIDDLKRSTVLRPLGTGAIQFARIVRTLLSLPLTLLSLATWLGFLIVISLPMTLGLFLILPAVLIPLYVLNKKVVRENREMRQLNERVRLAQRAAADAIVENQSRAAVDASLEAYVNDPAVERRHHIVAQNWTVAYRVQVVSEIFSNTVLVGLVFSVPLLLNTARAQTADLLGYVVALRFFFQFFQQLVRRLTIVSRFLEPAECLLNPRLVSVHFPAGDDEDLDNDAMYDM